MKTSKKTMKIMMAIAIVFMMAVSIMPVSNNESGLDAAVGDGGSYTYTISYNSSAMSSSTAVMTVADMTAISHTGSPTTVTAMTEGSWTWDSTTGYGPFNSFYAAFDLTQGNKFVAILNPYDLTETISGETLTPLTNYNIMWVLPTVYISSTSSSMTLSNDPSAGTAYAHTIDGHTYKYVAYGVYEGSTTTVDNKTVLTSTSGTTPAANQTRATFRTYAHNYTMSPSLGTNAHSMQWNFDQWQLYKDICFAVMENTNSQNTVGNGHVFSSNSTYAYTTGALNALGPYAGNPARITDNNNAPTYGSDSVKLFIENAWGGVNEFVDGIMIKGKTNAYIDSKSTPNDATSGSYISSVSWTLPSSGYPVSIQTGSARVWGFPGSTVNGSDTTGLADYIYTSTSDNRVLFVGGGANSDWSNSVQYGLSCAYAAASTVANTTLGSRLAFVFDADPAASTVELTFNATETGYGTLSDGTQTGQSTITVSDVTSGTTLSVSNNTLTINDSTTTTITATPTTSDDHWTYSFDGWYIGTSKIVTSTTVSDDTAITAKFTRALTTHTAQVESNNLNYGTVSVGYLNNIPYGETFTVNGSTLSIYNQSVVALATPDTVRYEYSFDGFETEGHLITTGMAMVSDLTIRATFSCTELVYTVVVQSNNLSYGTVTNSGSYSGVPGGSTFTVNNTALRLQPLDGTPIDFTANVASADAQYTYAFDGWYDALSHGNRIETGDMVTDNMTVYAIFTATLNEYTVSAESNNTSYGTVDHSSVANVPYGTVVSVNGDKINVNGTVITATPKPATPSATYSFVEWRVNNTPVTTSYTVQGATTFTAVFTDEDVYYQVDFAATPSGYGSLSPSVSYLSVPYGSHFAVSGTSLTLDSTTITATPTTEDAQYTYSFVGWFTAPTGGTEITSSTTVTSAMNVYARFTATLNEYTVSAESNNTSFGTVDHASVANVPYGTVVTVSNDKITVNGTVITATPNPATASTVYSFVEWRVNGTAVTESYTVQGATTFTAVFSDGTVSYQVDFAAYPTEYGSISPATSSLTVPYGTHFSVSGSSLTLDSTTFTATPKAEDVQYTYSFVGWFTAPTGGTEITSSTTVTSAMNVYAVFTASERAYTVFSGTNDPDLGTVSPAQSAMPIPYGSVVTVGRNTISMNGTVVFTGTPAASTPEIVYTLSKWQMNGVDVVSGVTTTTGADTFTAVFVQATDEDTAVLRYNVNGGQGTFSDQIDIRSGSETSYTFTISENHPTRSSHEFAGWSTTATGSVEYQPGDEITVNYGEIVVLYAIYETGPAMSIVTIAPYMAIIGIVLGVVGAFFAAQRGVIETRVLIEIIIGAAVAVLVVALVLIPLVG